jgi:hypothetical protein
VTTPAHTLVITNRGDGQHYAIKCHGVTDHCRVWQEADCPQAKASDEWDGEGWFDYEGEEVAHGVTHAYVDGAWSHPTGQCWLEIYPDLPDAARDLQAGPGQYDVIHEYECGGDGAFTLALTEPTVVLR